ncbi:hypothetical protein DNTS_004414 [Danionella cerebrum]|uniref:Uncharacterized protein n=1 Tax=Danionella cerebrum TaxID=2873325 RepID=A0A553NH90_9TELE|nr:hypothetical protein DNTS_004414 [Danionella translucida]
MTLTAEAGPESGQLLLKQKNVHQGVETVTGPVPCPMKRLETADVKLARLKQIMQRSLSESDGDGYPPDDAKNASRTERPNQLAITEAEQPKTKLSSERKFLFTHRTSKSIDVCNPSPSSENSDPESKMEAGESHDGNKATTSPKSALKSPTSRRKTAQNLKLRVTFDEPPRKDGSATVNGKPVTAKEKVDSGKRAFGTFRSIMETLSGNQNGNNNNIQSPGKKKSEAKNKSKTRGTQTALKILKVFLLLIGAVRKRERDRQTERHALPSRSNIIDSAGLLLAVRTTAGKQLPEASLKDEPEPPPTPEVEQKEKEKG